MEVLIWKHPVQPVKQRLARDANAKNEKHHTGMKTAVLDEVSPSGPLGVVNPPLSRAPSPLSILESS